MLNFDEGFYRDKLKVIGAVLFVSGLVLFFGFNGFILALGWGLYELFREF